MGVSIAWQLAARLDPIDEPVVLLERTDLGAGSSGRSGAILRQHYSDMEVAAMARDSLRFYAGFQARTGTSIGFRRCGVLTIAGPSDPEMLERIERNIRMQQSIGIRTQRLSSREIAEQFPMLQVSAGSIAAYEPEAGFVDPMRTVSAFAAQARYRGAITRLGESALGLQVHAGRVRGVETETETIETQIVVVAAGPWTKAWMNQCGIALPLRCVKPEQAFLSSVPAQQSRAAGRLPGAPAAESWEQRFATNESPDDPVGHPVLLDVEHGYYARCQPTDGRTRVGGMDYHDCQELAHPDQFDDQVRVSFRDWAHGALAKRIPAYAKQPHAGTLAAMYTLTPDAQALMGPLPSIQGLYVCTGFSGHGFKLAPSVGEGMAQLVLGEPVSAFDTKFFAPLRFAGAQQAHGSSSSGAFGL